MFSIRMVTNFLVSAALGLGLVLGAVKEARVLAQWAVSQARVAVVQSLDSFGSAMAEVALQFQWELGDRIEAGGAVDGEASVEAQPEAADRPSPEEGGQEGESGDTPPEAGRPGRVFQPWRWMSSAFPDLHLSIAADASAEG